MASSQDSEGLLSPLLAWWRLRQVVRHISPGERVLDCGCGSGRLSRILPPNCLYVGVDVHVEALPEPDDASVYMALDLTSPPAISQLHRLKPFDVIVLAALVEHVDQPARLLGALRDLVTATGRIILTTPSPRTLAIHRMGGRVGLFSRHGAEQHKGLLDRDAVYGIAKQAGLQVIVYRTFQAGLNQLAVLQPERLRA